MEQDIRARLEAMTSQQLIASYERLRAYLTDLSICDEQEIQEVDEVFADV